MRNLLLVFLVLTLIFPAIDQAIAADIEFESFEAAESAAQKRAKEYKQKMDEHMKNIQQEWEEQQRDLGSDGSNPDITKITSRSDGQKSSDTDAADNMANAVNSSVNKLKETMINTAGPNSTGFAGGGAGYQWSVKYVGGKYVLSDSYNEADFNTGKKKEKPAPTTPKPEPKANEGSDDEETVIAKAPDKPAATTTPTSSDPAGSKSEPAPTPVSSTPGTPSSSATNPGTSTPTSPGSSGSSSATPANEPAVAPANPAKEPSPAPTSPGIDPAPANLPPPAVRLVIQHPTDFSEEVFSSNTDKQDSSSYDLEKFKIPEDTRVKIAVEVSKDINPEDVTLVIVDEEGERAPVAASKMGNYRHMFRVPSDGNYSANVYVTDKDKPGNRQKKLMQVKIPVTKVDFDSRTIDNQRGTKSSDGSSSSSMSSTSSSGSSGDFKHSGQGRSQQVDLSDLYSDPRQSSANNSDNAGSSDSTAAAGSAGSSSGGSAGSSSGAASSSGSSSDTAASASQGGNGSSEYASAQSDGGAQGNAADGSAGGAADGSSSYSSNSSSGQGNSNESDASSGDASAADNNETGSSQNDNSSAASSEDSHYADNSDNANNSGSSGNADTQAGNSDEDYAGNTSSDENSGDYAGSGNSDSDYNGGDTANSSGDNGDLADNQYASAKDLSSSSSSSSSANKNNDSSASGAANAKTGDIPEEEPEEDNFIMSVGLRSEAHKIYQSFDFAEDPNQKSTTLPAGSEITFNIVLGKQVDFDSVSIQMADGSEVFGGNLRTMGEAFAYSFKNPSPDSYIQISGKSGKTPFTYRLITPVAAK